MGALNSKQLDVTTIANTVSNAMVTQMQNCGSSQGVQQTIKFTNNGGAIILGEVNQDSSVNISIDCFQTASFQQDVKTSMKVALEESIKQANSGLFFSSNTNISETTVQAINNVVSSVDLKQVQNCLSQALVSQNQDYENDKGGLIKVGSINQTVAISTTNKCIANQAGFQEAVANLSNTVKSETDQSNKGLDMVACIAALACLAAVIASIIFQILKAPATLGKSAAQGAASLASIPATVASSSMSPSVGPQVSSNGAQSNDMWKYALVLIGCLCSSSSAGAGVFQMQQKKT
jgi:hypothetical protein